VTVRHHVIREVVTDVLGADVWWGDDEDADEGVKLGRGKRNVPKAIIEEGCIVRRLTFLVSFV
jgi:hypothetical protein